MINQKEYKETVKERIKILKKFEKYLNEPPVVHAIKNPKTFKKILKENYLKIPLEHESKKQCSTTDKFLGNANCLYYSIGFVYQTLHGYKYNLLFNLDFLKDLEYYKLSINFQCIKAIIKYWEKHDKQYLEELRHKSKKCEEVLEKYYFRESKDKQRRLFEYWKIDKEITNHIQNYPNQKKIKEFIKETNKKYYVKYPYSKQSAKFCSRKNAAPEILGSKNINFLKTENFIGFYIPDKIPKEILRILKKKYSNKILFDGKIAKKIKELY